MSNFFNGLIIFGSAAFTALVSKIILFSRARFFLFLITPVQRLSPRLVGGVWRSGGKLLAPPREVSRAASIGFFYRFFLLRPSAARLFLIPTVSLFLFFPAFSALAAWNPAEPIVPCGGAGQSSCDWKGLIQLASNILDVIIYFAVFLAVIFFAYAGFKYLTAGANVGAIKSAHQIFRNVFLGLVLTLSAWLIVELILTSLTEDFSLNNSYSLFPRNIERKIVANQQLPEQ